MRDVEQGTLVSLADKLNSLTLSEPEQALLERLLDRATSYQPEVAGFADFNYTGDRSGADLSPMAFKVGSGLGIIQGGIGLGDKNIMFETFDRPPPP